MSPKLNFGFLKFALATNTQEKFDVKCYAVFSTSYNL